MRRSVRNCVLTLVVVLWIGGIVGGFSLWESYETTAGPSAVPGEASPARVAELAIYVHPHCPCSRTSLAELAELMPSIRGALTVRIVFVRPPGTTDGWERGETWDAAKAIPGAVVTTDPEGVEARAAGATTSGCAVCRDDRGVVQFRGGLTNARGRRGDNRGRQAVVAIAAGEQPNHREAPTFGCSLFD